MKWEPDERKLHRIAKIDNNLEIWEGSQHLCATKKELRAQNNPMTAVEYILDKEGIVNASWSLFQHDGAAAFKLLERSPLTPAFSAKDRPGGPTEILNVCRIWRVDCHPLESEEDSAPNGISDTENRLH